MHLESKRKRRIVGNECKGSGINGERFDEFKLKMMIQMMFTSTKADEKSGTHSKSLSYVVF